MEQDRHLANDLGVTRRIVLRKGFEGFSQTFIFKCVPPHNQNKCVVNMSIFSPKLSEGNILLKLGKGKCEDCQLQHFADKLSIPLEIEKASTTI